MGHERGSHIIITTHESTVTKLSFPYSKCNEYSAKPPIILLFSDGNKNKSILWIFTGIITHSEDIWFVVSNIILRQSNWHGCILTYTKTYPFRSSFMGNVSYLMKKWYVQQTIHISLFFFNNTNLQIIMRLKIVI